MLKQWYKKTRFLEQNASLLFRFCSFHAATMHLQLQVSSPCIYIFVSFGKARIWRMLFFHVKHVLPYYYLLLHILQSLCRFLSSALADVVLLLLLPLLLYGMDADGAEEGRHGVPTVYSTVHRQC